MSKLGNTEKLEKTMRNILSNIFLDCKYIMSMYCRPLESTGSRILRVSHKTLPTSSITQVSDHLGLKTWTFWNSSTNSLLKKVQDLFFSSKLAWHIADIEMLVTLYFTLEYKGWVSKNYS